MENQNFVVIPGLYDAAYRAYSGTSFSPERRAADTVKDHESQLNGDLAGIPESERARYIDGYNKRLFAWMSAKSRCLSSMITGPARFPVERNRKANESEHNRSVEFSEWRDKVLTSIAKRVEDAKPEEQKADERWVLIKRKFESSIATIISIDAGESYYSRALFVNTITGPIKTFAKNGEVDLVNRSLDLIAFWNGQVFTKPIIAAKNGIWALRQEVEKVRELAVDKSVAESLEYEIGGVKVVQNIAEDRIQIFFDGKPEPAMIASLKHSAFKWSPSRGCWQRQLTSNAIYATKKLLS